MISVLVVNWNSGDRLRSLLAGLSEIEGIETAVCDNDSRDGSADDLPEKVRVERPGRNLGFGGALNLLAEQAQGEILLFLNPDCTVEPEALRRLEEFYREHPDADLVGLTLVGADEVPQGRYGPKSLPTLGSLAAEALLLRRPSAADASPPAATGRVEQVAGAAMSIRAERFRELHGFDAELWPAWYEDVDICRRAQDAEMEVWHLAEATIRHEGGYSRGPLGYAGLLPAYYGNQIRYARKHLGFFSSLLLRILIAKGMLLRMAAAAVAPGLAGSSRGEAFAAFGRVLGVAAGADHRRHHR